MPPRKETCGWADLLSGKVVWLLMLQLRQGPAPNRRLSCGCFSSWVDLDLIPSSISGRNSSPTAPQTSSSLPMALPPQVPFPQHPSYRFLGFTAQRTNTLRGESALTGTPVLPCGAAASRAALWFSSCRSPFLQDARLVAGWMLCC